LEVNEGDRVTVASEARVGPPPRLIKWGTSVETGAAVVLMGMQSLLKNILNKV